MENKVKLQTSFKRGDKEITEILVRKPNAGELRGIKIVQLLEADADALFILLPRITSPTLTQQEINNLDPADFMDMGLCVANFLAKKEMAVQPM